MNRRERSIRSPEIFLFFVFLVSYFHHLAALSITVTDVECVYEIVRFEGDTISGNFIVIGHDIFWNSDRPIIDLDVASPRGNIVHSIKETSGDKFEFKAPMHGPYKFCFHNPQRRPETVSFYIHVGHIPTHDLAKDEHFDSINVMIAKLREALDYVAAEQQYLKAQEARHRHTNENTRKRLTFYTLAEYLALVCASLLQGVYIRRLFSKTEAYIRLP